MFEKIKNETLRGHIQKIVDSCPQYYKEIPSSMTGKYHPQDETGEGGTLRHIRRCLVFAEEASRMYDLDDFGCDVLCSACILHDIYKVGLEKPEFLKTDPMHPVYIFDKIEEYICANELDEEIKKYLYYIQFACLFHEGRWSCDKVGEILFTLKPSNRAAYYGTLMHIVDYFASRRSVAECFKEGF